MGAAAVPKHVSLPVPHFWRGTLEDVDQTLGIVRKGAVSIVGDSAGGRPIHAVTYGEANPLVRTANYSSALGAGMPHAYVRKEGRRPSVMLVGATHGAEMEGIVGLNNLMHVLETGADYRGLCWDGIVRATEGVRLSIIPCLNPDGRARVEPKSMVGETLDFCRYWTQGTRSDGKLYTWPEVKEFHPIQDVGFLGGYFNDDGVNPMHDNFFMHPCNEVQTLFRFADAEVPDVLILLHTGGSTFLFLQTQHIPDAYRQQIYHLGRTIEADMGERGMRFNPELCNPARGKDSKTPSFNLTSALHHLTGTLSITLESPAGLIDAHGIPVADWDTILDGHLMIFENVLRYVAGDGS